MARATRFNNVRSVGSRFGGGTATQRRQDLVVTVVSYHFSTDPNAPEEDNYMVVRLLGSARHFRETYEPGTEFKAFFPKPPELKKESSLVPRNTVRRLSKKSGSGFSTGDALVPGSDILLEGCSIQERAGEKIIVARYGRGLLNNYGKYVQLTDEEGKPFFGYDDNGNEVPIETLCGKTYANVYALVQNPQEYEVNGENGPEKRRQMSGTLFFPEKATVIRPDAGAVWDQVGTALLNHAFFDFSEDRDWGLRGLMIYSARLPEAELSEEEKVEYFRDPDNMPTVARLFLRHLREGEDGKGDLRAWSEDGQEELAAAIEYFRASEAPGMKRTVEAFDNPENYAIWLVPILRANFQPSLLPGAVLDDTRIQERNLPQAGSVFDGYEVFQNGNPVEYAYPGSSEKGPVFTEVQQSKILGLLRFTALTLSRHVRHYESLPLNDNTLLSKVPYSEMEKAPYKILPYLQPTISRAEISLLTHWDEDTKARTEFSVPRSAAIYIENLTVPGLPEPLIEAHRKMTLELQHMSYAYRIESGLSPRPDDWPNDDGSAPDDAEDHFDSNGSAGGEASRQNSSTSNSGGQSWDTNGSDDDIPF